MAGSVGLQKVTFTLANSFSSVIVNYNTSSLRSRKAAGARKMREKIGQYLNDVVSLSVVMLMAIALIAGQSGASAHGAAKADQHGSLPALTEMSVGVETSAQVLMLHIDTVLDETLKTLPVIQIVSHKIKLGK